MSVALAPITLRQARAFVHEHHRHHRKVTGGLFAVALLRALQSQSVVELVGVAIAGRPVAGGLQDGRTLEIIRCCVLGGIPNGCSMLYRALVRAGEALGYERFITYTLETEHGRSLSAAGFKPTALTRGGSWSRDARRRGTGENEGRKTRWEVDGSRAPASLIS